MKGLIIRDLRQRNIDRILAVILYTPLQPLEVGQISSYGGSAREALHGIEDNPQNKLTQALDEGYPTTYTEQEGETVFTIHNKKGD